MGKNTALAASIFQELLVLGVRELCVCPGARNAPWVALLSENPSLFQTYYFYEERSASFFALGCIRRTARPVAVVTTSGTAAGELLPATMEAYYAGMPLILLTADRPRYYRGQGTPQTAEQVGLFGIYVSHTFDLQGDERMHLRKPLEQPIHINVCFDEPLLDGRFSDFKKEESLSLQLGSKSLVTGEAGIAAFFGKVKNPLVIVGMLSPWERTPVARLLQDTLLPVFFEATSGLRESSLFPDSQLRFSDGLIEFAHHSDYPLDGILRIGGVPTLRLWRDLEGKYQNLPVLSLSRLCFSGLGRASFLATGSMDDLCGLVLDYFRKHHSFKPEIRNWISRDREIARKIQLLLEEEPSSEPGMVFALSQMVPQKSRVYLGNSLPIREWDLAADFQDQGMEVWASRGLNGIDGQVSTFLGFAHPEFENWALIGDLTALYDLSGPWILSQMKDIPISIVVINNGGGKIFSRLFSYPEFQNCHSLRFKSWAELWGINFESWARVPKTIDREKSTKQSRHWLIELVPDDQATQRFWSRVASLSL